jgi:hypothetical protein
MLSPMLGEDPLSSTEGSDILFPLSFDELGEWDKRDGTASVGLSFMESWTRSSLPLSSYPKGCPFIWKASNLKRFVERPQTEPFL